MLHASFVYFLNESLGYWLRTDGILVLPLKKGSAKLPFFDPSLQHGPERYRHQRRVSTWIKGSVESGGNGLRSRGTRGDGTILADSS